MSPRRRHPQPADPRTHLMDAALRAFAQRGYEGASVRDIAAEAQVAPGLIYHYFPSKQAILEALFERSAGAVMAAFAEVAEIAEPREKLGALLRVSARLVRADLDFWRVSYGVRFQHAVIAGLAEGIAANAALYREMFTAMLVDISAHEMRADIIIGRPEPETEALLLFAALDGVFQHFILAPETYPLDAVIDRLILQHGGTTSTETP